MRGGFEAGAGAEDGAPTNLRQPIASRLTRADFPRTENLCPTAPTNIPSLHVNSNPPLCYNPPMFPPPRHIPPPLASGSRAALNFLAIHSGPLLCALFLLAGLVLAGDYGINYDERAQRQIAQANRDYLLGQSDRIAPELYHDRVYGIVFELPLLLAEQVLGLTDYHHVHRFRLTITHLLFLLGAFFCYRLAWRLTGNRLIALLALLLFLLHPRIYAHSYLNSKDLPFLSIFIIALYLLERAFRKDTIAAFLLLGVAVGILTNLRIMGITLLAATLALRGLDLWHAANWPQRKAILLTAGLFILTAGLTLYAVTPYAWANPIDYLNTSLSLTVNHPVVLPQLFQGQLLLSNDLPPYYAAVWFGITTPPLILLLGFIGMAAVAARCIRRPKALFRNGRQRFLLLLPACFLLPPLAAALLGSNQYEGWRQLYFLYAPFCLLAALGGGWLLTALSRRRPWRMGLYGLAGLGLALIALQMAQIHPLQSSYFNFLVNRATPEYLQTQYPMDYWKLAARESLQDLLSAHPSETLIVRTGRRHINILPPAARQYITPDSLDRRADYALSSPPASYQPDLAFNSPYRRRLYNNTLSAARPLDSARMTPAASAAYRELYRQATASQPVIRADYAVYVDGRQLTFIQENCPPDGPEVWFGVKPIPPAPETFPPYFPQPGFYAPYHNRRVRVDDLCLAVIQLPAEVGGDLILMQRSAGNYEPGGIALWEGLHSLSQPGLRELIAQGRQPAAEDDSFAVVLDRRNGRPRLLYAKADCSPTEYTTPVFLHLYPARPRDLPPAARAINFENRDFSLETYGGRPEGECVAIVPLPNYPIVEIRTGQTGSWSHRLYPAANIDRLPAEYAALAGQEPEARAVFDLYRQNNRLLYLRETCTAADTAANFFLHIVPQDTADLPPERRPYGFANHDFAFAWWGGHFNGRCLAAVPLPDYPIKTLRTGQHAPGQGQLWAVELAVEN